MSCLKFLKCYVSFSAIVSLLVGLATIILSGILLKWNSDIFILGAKSMKDKALWSLLSFGVVLFLVSALGIYAALKKKKIGVYSFTNFFNLFSL